MTPLLWRLVAYAAALGAAIAFGWHLGAGHVQSRWNAATLVQEREYAAKVAAAQATTATWQGKADQAAKERDDALQNLATYRAAHPIGHVWVCKQPAQTGPALPSSAPSGITGTPPVTVLQPEAARDIGPDLDALAALADQVNESYRQCRAVYQALH